MAAASSCVANDHVVKFAANATGVTPLHNTFMLAHFWAHHQLV
jgi:hypothetical protein